MKSKKHITSKRSRCRCSGICVCWIENASKTKNRPLSYFIKTIGTGKDTAFSRYMKDTVFLIPTAKVLAKVVDGIDSMDMNNKDIMGDVYEYLLGKIAAAGENGQFRTPRHIINMMVELMQPTLKDRILEICTTSLIRIAEA